MTYQEFKENFLPEFLKIKSFKGKMDYANQQLTRIGSGSGRVVYDIDGEKVLKLAKNTKGIAQNETEAGIGYYRDTQNIVTIVFDSADNNEWLISEKAKKVNETKIKQLTGIPSLYELFKYLKNFYSSNSDVIKFLDNNEFAQELQEFIANYSQQPGDMGRPSTYGEVLRDGQPTIVLTDYGLNDEVYDTYYSPKRQGYRMYEMYNFQDGNDDILSDMPPQDAVDTRQSMWAIMPYGVGDGPGVINEDFISFVLNRDKYPTRVLPSTPYILDEFHNVVNNLNEVLKNVSDKKKFYNNLLELQDYLIRGKFYDREPLEKEIMELHEANTRGVEPTTLKRSYGDSIAQAFTLKLNLGEPQYLGGGGYGYAYLINDNKVLKLTTDTCEVDAGAKTNSAKPKTLVYVYKLYKIRDTEKNLSLYALIEDHIADKPLNEFNRYIEIIDSLGKDLYGRLLGVLIKGRANKNDEEFQGKTLNDFPELVDIILTSNPTANIEQSDRQKAYEFMMGLYEIKLDLLRLGIKSNDYIEPKNLGYKDGILTYFDIGGCRVPEPNIHTDDIISLPESAEVLDEVVKRDVADSIANQIAQKYGHGTPKYVGEGMFGIAYDIGNNMVLKVTGDKSEANENLELIGKPLKYIAKPYKVFSVKSKSGETETYVIILEKLRTDPAKFKAIKDRMDFAFNRIMGVTFADVISNYIYHDDYDIDEEKIQKYLSRNPVDAEYFNNILKIADEAKLYGVESIDYVNPTNLGYKPDGSLGFFDVGFGNYYFKSNNQPEEVQVDEDGSALYSTENSFGQDNFPVYDNNDTSPSISNDLNANSEVNEDLEYNHVVGDATQDEFQITERQKSYMPGSSSVEVKQKCRLAGNGNTSTACNQGDINNLNIKPLNEVNGSHPKDFWAWVSPDNQLTKVPFLSHKGYIMTKYKDRDFGWDYERVFEQAIKDGWVRVTYEYYPSDFHGSLSLNGYNKDRVKQVFKDKFFSLVQYGNNTIFIDYENPKGSEQFSTRDSDGKAKLINYINEEIDAKEVVGDDNKALKSVIAGKRDACFIEMNLQNAKLVQKNHLGAFPVRMTSQNTMMAIVYRDKLKALKLYKIAMEKGGYLNDKSPDEAREIGQLLGYKEASISEYIHRNYNKPPTMPNKSPDDYDDLAENQFSSQEKQIEKDNVTHRLDKELIRTYSDGVDVNPVYAVNGDEVRDSGFIEWVEGGNHWVDADLPKSEQKYAKHIPADELWVDDVHLSKPNDFEAILLHERTESYLIKHFGYSYDDAHDIANKIELLYRQKTHNISDEEESKRISTLMYTAFKKKFKKHKIHKRTQDEGVADVAAEKQFGIEPPHRGFEDKFNREEKEDVVFVSSISDLVIIRNPKSLNNIWGYVRGVIDPEGNLYTEQKTAGIHFDMLYALNDLGLVEDEADWDSKLPTNFVTVQRYKRTNKYCLGESNYSMYQTELRPNLELEHSAFWDKIPTLEEAEPVYRRFLNKAKQKNPTIDFINEPIQHYEDKIEIKNALNESLKEQCQIVSINPEIQKYLLKFNSDEDLLRAGGIPTELLDRAAFGFDDTLNKLMPKQLSIKWNDDLENVKWEIKKKGLTDIQFAKNVDLSKPIDVSFDGKNFNIEDGHHRYYAAKVLNLPLNINLEIKANPIVVLGNGMEYDEFHRCIWKQAHGQNNDMK